MPTSAESRTDSELREILLLTVQALVDHPEQVTVDSAEGVSATLLEVQVAPCDQGQLLGRGRRTEQALRNLLFAISGSLAHDYHLILLKPMHDDWQADEAAPSEFEQSPVEVTRHLLLGWLRYLTDSPEAVHVALFQGTATVVFEVKTAQEDMRHVIGSRGRTAEAIRVVLGNLGFRCRKNFLITFIEPQ